MDQEFMDQETKKLLNAIWRNLDRMDKRINDKIDAMQRDINILRVRYDHIDRSFYAEQPFLEPSVR